MNELLRLLANQPWAIRQDVLAAMLKLAKAYGRETPQDPRLVAFAAEKAAIEEAEEMARHAARVGRPATARGKAVAVIPVMGTIRQRGGGFFSMLFGGASTDAIGAAFRQAMADDQVGAIVLNVDSPGGSVPGVQELAAEILAARGQGKPIVAVANSMMASAAYWIGSAADEIVATPSGEVGSIGVWAAHVDYSQAMEAEGIKITFISAGKYKVEGNPYQPLDPAAQEFLQSRVDETYGAFVDAVAAGRGIKSADVRAGFGEGRVLSAAGSKAAGMVDRVATLQQTLDRLAGGAVVTPGGADAHAETERWRAFLENRRA